MAFLDNSNVEVRGLAAAVPANVVDVHDIYRPEWGDVEDFIKATTVRSLHISKPGQTTSDLCVAAADRLLEDLQWERESVEAVVLVTQTPDYYFVPATACHIQERLGLSKSCLAFDITLGCSGWVYGMGVLSSMLNSGSIKRALLLAGDTCSKTANPDDQGAAPLFGDAGTATALEFNPSVSDSQSNHCNGGGTLSGIRAALFTDGDGHDAIICREGGFRTPLTADAFPYRIDAEGHKRYPLCGEMDGMSVFTFAISQAPKSIKALVEHFGIDRDKVDILALHQANLMINEKIIKKAKCANARCPQSMMDYGNTSCASIPLSLVTEESEALRNGKNLVLACGFGVGLSWGALSFVSDRIIVPSLIEI